MNKELLFIHEEVEDWLTENETLWDWDEMGRIVLHTDKTPSIVKKIVEKYNRS